MMEFMDSLSFLEKIYLVCAVFGGGLFALRTVLLLVGIGDTDVDTDVDVDVDSADLDHDHSRFDDIDHGDHDAGGLKFLTLQGLTAFVMMFGLTGYSFSQGSLLNTFMTIIVSILIGLFAMWLIAKGFALMKSFQSSGNMQIYDALGEEGTVYLTIPSDGIGKIQIVVSGRLMVMDAVSQDKVELKTGERICVSEITSGGMFSVRGV